MGSVVPARVCPLLLVDGHHLLWSGTMGFPAEIRSRDKTRELTGAFAFFALLRCVVRDDLDTTAPEIIVVFDGEQGSADRKTEDADYKANRPTTPEALKPLQFLQPVKDGLDAFGFAWTEVENAEADDSIATLARAHPDRPVRIMSGDQDYYQLLDADHVRVIARSRNAGKRVIGPEEVTGRFKVTPAQWADYRSLTGDPSDNIPGVRGIGPGTAAKYLSGGLTLDELPTSGRLTGVKGQAVHDAWPDVLRWRDMIRMRTDVPVTAHPTGVPSPELPKAADVIAKLGLW
ncbi:5'-3' exonuclease H3TH domain-containing protein [Embleya sp. NPDC059237]|uniref:5'-3' exonuclease n=1 Tax=Embleya sp. NPDC059237 TaxID=3346784 RepID=UPI0036A276D0